MAGGSTINSLAAVVGCGGRGAFTGKIALGDSSTDYMRRLESLGIHFTSAASAHRMLGAAEIPKGHSGLCAVFVSPSGERTCFADSGMSGNLCASDINRDLLASSHYLLIEGHLLASGETARIAIEETVRFIKDLPRANRPKIALSLSAPYVIRSHRSFILDLMQESDLVFANRHECAEISQEFSDPRLAFDIMRRYASNIVVTEDEEGANIFIEGAAFHIPAFDVKAVDATGAGDAFSGVLLFGLATNLHPLLAATTASLVASRVVESGKTRLPAEMYRSLWLESTNRIHAISNLRPSSDAAI